MRISGRDAHDETTESQRKKNQTVDHLEACDDDL